MWTYCPQIIGASQMWSGNESSWAAGHLFSTFTFPISTFYLIQHLFPFGLEIFQTKLDILNHVWWEGMGEEKVHSTWVLGWWVEGGACQTPSSLTFAVCRLTCRYFLRQTLHCKPELYREPTPSPTSPDCVLTEHLSCQWDFSLSLVRECSTFTRVRGKMTTTAIRHCYCVQSMSWLSQQKLRSLLKSKKTSFGV